MPKTYDPEFKARAVRLVRDHLSDYGSVTAASFAVAAQLGVSRETLRRWVVQAQVDDGIRPGVTTAEAERQLVVDRERAFNRMLADVCAQYTRCRWDGGAVYNYQFSASQVSTLDFLPPQPERPSGPGPGHLGRVLVAQQLTQQASARAWTLAWVGSSSGCCCGSRCQLVNAGAWVVTRSGRRVRPGSAADSGFTPSL